MTYTGTVLDHTIESECLAYRFKNAETDQIGNFTFTLPGRKGLTKFYDDIALYDKVYYYAGYGTVGATPLFAGRIETIQNQKVGIDQYVRTFSGHDLGEVTARRLWMQKSTEHEHGDVIVDEWADNMSIGNTIEAETTDLDIVSHESNYLTLLKDVCNYAASIDRDWCVDVGDAGHVNGHLVWHSRPWRTVGVSTFTVGTNILTYTLTRDLTEVYNNIYGFGAIEPTMPNTSACAAHDASHVGPQYDISPSDDPVDHDAWTEAIGIWTADSGSGNAYMALGGAVHHVGTNSILELVDVGDSQAHEWLTATCTLPHIVRIKDTARLNFCWCCETVTGVVEHAAVTLCTPDTAHYYIMNLSNTDPYLFPPDYTVAWRHYSLPLGPGSEDVSGSDKWMRNVGHGEWFDIEAIRFYLDMSNAVGESVAQWIDGLYFSNLRWHDYTTNAGSIAAYGQRDLVTVDDRLHSTADVTNYLAMVNAKHANPFLQLDIVSPMDTNILIGDRIPITIPDENLLAENFDVIRVEQTMAPKPIGFQTRTTLTGAGRTRTPSKATNPEGIMRDLKERQLDGVNSRWATWR